MGARNDDRPSAVTYFGCLAQIAFQTLVYWLVGSLPEENHSKKGDAWARIGAYRWAAWHFRKYLKYSDDSFGRASLGWCYANLGMIEPAVQHYRLAYARSHRPDVACVLAQAELAAGNIAAARELVAQIAARRNELSSEFVPAFAELEVQVASDATAPIVPTTGIVSAVPERDGDEQSISTGRRLISALIKGWLSFAAASLVIAVPRVLSRSPTPAEVFELLQVASIAAAVVGAGLVVIHAPVLGLMRARLGNRLTKRLAGILGAALIPVLIAVYVTALAAATGTPVRMWRWFEFVAFRPIAFLVWFAPFVVSGVVFALAFARSDDWSSDPRSPGPRRPTRVASTVGLSRDTHEQS